MKVLLPIKPKYVENIIEGTKKYEYRKQSIRQGTTHILIYETSPKKLVVAEVRIQKIISGTPDEIWERTKEYSGIKKEDFGNYFANRKDAYAYELGDVEIFENPKKLIEYGVNYRLQNKKYIY